MEKRRRHQNHELCWHGARTELLSMHPTVCAGDLQSREVSKRDFLLDHTETTSVGYYRVGCCGCYIMLTSLRLNHICYSAHIHCFRWISYPINITGITGVILQPGWSSRRGHSISDLACSQLPGAVNRITFDLTSKSYSSPLPSCNLTVAKWYLMLTSMSLFRISSCHGTDFSGFLAQWFPVWALTFLSIRSGDDNDFKSYFSKIMDVKSHL